MCNGYDHIDKIERVYVLGDYDHVCDLGWPRFNFNAPRNYPVLFMTLLLPAYDAN